MAFSQFAQAQAETGRNGRFQTPELAPDVDPGSKADTIKHLLPGRYARLITVVVAEVTVTADAAREILANHVARRRPTCRASVARLIGDLAAGNFLLNGETVVFDSNGDCINGLHRLTACAQSGVSFQTVIVLQVPPERFTTFDQHRKRNSGQVLAMAGEASGNILGGAASVVRTFLRNGTVDRANPPLTIAEVRGVIDAHPDLRGSVQANHHHYLGKVFKSPSLAAALHYLFGLAAPAAADDLWRRIDESDLSGPDFAIARLLKKRLEGNRESPAKLPLDHLAALTIKAWNYLHRGESRDVLTYSPGAKERFPRILGWSYDAAGVPLGVAGGEWHHEATRGGGGR